jgi:hypothetical protein
MVSASQTPRQALLPRSLINYKYVLTPLYPAFQTAVALADYRAQKEGRSSEPVLDLPDFEHVLNLTSEFKAYLLRIDGVNQAAKAYRDRLRGPSAEQSSTGK